MLPAKLQSRGIDGVPCTAWQTDSEDVVAAEGAEVVELGMGQTDWEGHVLGRDCHVLQFDADGYVELVSGVGYSGVGFDTYVGSTCPTGHAHCLLGVYIVGTSGLQ